MRIMSALEFAPKCARRKGVRATYEANLTQVATILHLVPTEWVLAWVRRGPVFAGTWNAGSCTVLGESETDSRCLVG